MKVSIDKLLDVAVTTTKPHPFSREYVVVWATYKEFETVQQYRVPEYMTVERFKKTTDYTDAVKEAVGKLKAKLETAYGHIQDVMTEEGE